MNFIGDNLDGLPTDNSEPTPSELAVMDKIFKKKKEDIKKPKTLEDKCNKNSLLLVLAGGLISAILALPFFNKLVEMCGGKNFVIKLIANFIVFIILFFLVQKQIS